MLTEEILARIRKLLAVAEHPTSPAGEADAAARAAERLIAKYAVDEALLEAAASARTTPEIRSIFIETPYATAKITLVGAVATAYGVRAISHRGSDPLRMTLVGFGADLQVVDLLYTSLLLQATTSLRRQSTSGRAFRRAFLIGFAAEVGERLAAGRRDAVAEAGGAATALALRDREREVEAAVREQFPRLRATRATASDGRGLVAGRESGAAANLSSGRSQVNGHRTAIGAPAANRPQR
jgi:Protein of unknown function (DUF2786)